MSFFDDVRQAPPGRRRVVVADAPPASVAAPANTYNTSAGTGPNGGPASGNTGVAGDQSQTVVTPPASTRTAENNPGLDPAKWVSGHSSPKYVWQAAQQMFDQRTPEGRAATLAHVQKTNPEYFSGWVIDGDKIRHQSGELHSKFDGYNEFDAWRGSKAGEWGSQWLPTQRNGQAYIDPATQQAAPASTTQSAGGDIPASSPMTLPSSQSPSQSAAPLNQGAGGNQTTQGGGYGVDSGQGFGALMAPWEWEFDYGDFKAPTEADMLADPGYKFRRDQGQKAIERSASAEGSLLGGGTLRALMDFGQGLGSQEYGNVYNRKFGEFADARKSAFDEFSTAYNVFNRNQDVPFNRLAAIAGLGQTSAGQLGNQGQAFAANYGNTAMNGANAQGDYWTQAANAGAAGRIGGANAWNSALTNIGNNASQSYYNWQYRPQNRPPANSPFTFGTPVNVGGLG